jgi:hypothetical protein
MAQLDPRAFDSRIDFSPLMQALEGYRRGMDENNSYQGNQAMGGAIAKGDWATAMAAAGQYGKDPSVLLTLGDRARQEQERQRQAEALKNPLLTSGMKPAYAAALETLSPEQRAAQLAQAQSPMTAAQLDASRTSTALHGQQLQTARATAPYEIDMKRLQAQSAQREFDTPKDNLQKLKEDEALYRVNPRTGQAERVVGSDPNSVNAPEFRKASAKNLAETYQGYLAEGQKAVTSSADLQRLNELSDVVGSGKLGQWAPTVGPWLQSVGVDIRGLPEAQAFQAIANKMAPTMRPTGSGATSDRDMSIYMQSIPQLSQTPQGRKLVIQQFQAFNEYNRQRGAIASAVMSGKMQPAEGEQRIQQLPDPFQNFKSMIEGQTPKLPDGWSIQRVK